MKSKWSLISSIIQIAIGILAVVAFFVVACSGENSPKWIITLILAIAFVVLGVIGIVDYRSKK